MAQVVTSLTGTPLTPIQHGEWCPRCNLPSVAFMTVALEVNGSPLLILTLGVCGDCELEVPL